MATVRDLVRAAVRAAEEKKATDVKAIDMRGLSGVTDYMIIATGSSDTNVRAIAEGVREKLLEKGERPFSVEGLQEGSWVLLDYVDFVVHVFHYEKRLFFGLEELWADARPVPIADRAARTAPARTGAKTAARTGAKAALPQVPRGSLKPAATKRAVPKRAAAKPAAAKKAAAKKAAPKKTSAAKKPGPPKKATGPRRAAVPKPKKAAVPKRKPQG